MIYVWLSKTNFNSFCYCEHGRIVKFEQTIDKEIILCENQRTRFLKEKKERRNLK